MRIDELEKPAGTWCHHCKIGFGCSIYESRPSECRTFRCAYLVDPELDENWKPSVSKIVLMSDALLKRIDAHVDPHRPDAWKQPPYYARLKAWSKSSVQSGWRVIVFVGRQATVILPDRDVELGKLDLDEVVVTERVFTPNGPTYKVSKQRRSA